MQITDVIERAQLRDDLPDFRPGDTVKVHVRVVEGSRERIQVFQGFVLRRLLADEPRFRPDAIEAFNPTTLGRPMHGRVVQFADEHGLAKVGSSDAHSLEAIGVGYTTFPGRTADELRAAILAGTTHHHGSFHATGAQLGTFGQQLRKYGRDARASLGGRIRGDGTRRDLGYPPELAAAIGEPPRERDRRIER